MLTCIIVDDEKKNCEGLKNIIQTYIHDVVVVTTCQTVSEAVQAIKRHEPDLVFLDAELQGETGFDLLEHFEAIDFNIIFVSAYSQYAVKAIKVSAIDFLLKPVHIEDIRQALNKIKKRRLSRVLFGPVELLDLGRPAKRLAIPTLEGLSFICIADILYCKAAGNYTEIFIKGNKRIVTSKVLKQYEEILESYNFFRVHHSYLINLNYIYSYVKGEGGYVVMSDHTSIRVSRRRKEFFLEKIRLTS